MTVLAVLVGIIISSFVMFFLGVATIAGMAAAGDMQKPVEKGSVLRITLNAPIQETTTDDPLSKLTSGTTGAKEALSLDELVRAIAEAKNNDCIEGIYLEGGNPQAEPATLQELRQALLDFKEGGKWILSHADDYSGGGYYVCSVADQVSVNPIGMVDWHGMATELIFLKDALEKIGVKAEIFKVGTYKSAVEPFTNTQMSDANREQVTSYLSSIWNNYLVQTAKSRKMAPEALNAVADSFPALRETKLVKEWGLVDELAYTDQAKDALRKKLNLKDDDKIKFVTPTQLLASQKPKKKAKDGEVAVYYAWGSIVTEPAQTALLGGSHSIVGSTVANDLRKLREDDDVKAVVLRVNSGGGSVFASEEIWREVELLREEKPIVVSMGGMAASGGYYISCGANRIYADATTITGSIGVFAVFPDASSLLNNKLGLHFDGVKTNKMGDFGALGRPFNAEESRLIQRNVEITYDQFIKRVSDGRKMKEERVREIAEGRVWTGEQALELGLVDELGTLQDAIKGAAKLAKVEDYSTGRYPEEKPWWTQLLNGDVVDGYMEGRLARTLGDSYDIAKMASQLSQEDYLQARIPFMTDIH